MVDQGNALCADHKTGYKKKRKEHRKHLPIPEQQAPVATVSGEKSIRRKSPIRKNTDSFFVFIVHTCRILLQ